MISTKWNWADSLVPNVDVFLRVALWRMISDGTAFTPGGIVSRLLEVSAPPLLIVASPRLVVSFDNPSPDSLPVILGALSSHPSPIVINPVLRAGSYYRIGVDGVEISLSASSNGVPLPSDSFLANLLVPSPPSFSASSLVNRLFDLSSSPESLLVLDQVGGAVHFWESIEGGSDSVVASLPSESGLEPITATIAIS